MKRLIGLLVISVMSLLLFACGNDTTQTTTAIQTNTTTATQTNLTTAQTTSTNVTTTLNIESQIYKLLIEAEELSGMTDWNGLLISVGQDLNLPTSYKGVTITYSSREPSIVSNDGIVTLPDECWIESREQDGVTPIPNLNDNWPVVVDVLMTYLGHERTAKLMFIIAPEAGFTCDKYKG